MTSEQTPQRDPRTSADEPVRIDDGAFIATSFPGFVELMRSLGADLS